jgi:hypothetical protein
MKNLQTFNEFLNEAMVAANTIGNRIKGSAKDTTIIMNDITYTCLGNGKWNTSNGDKLTWIEVSAKASALGSEKIEFNKK